MASNNTTIVLILGCVVLGMLVVCGGTVGFLVWGTRTAVQFVGQEMEKEMERQAFAANWQPPPDDVSTEELFPAEVARWRRTSRDEGVVIPEYKIDIPGRRAVYESGGDSIEVFAHQASPLEAEALIRRVADTIDDREGGYRFRSGTPEEGRYRYSISPPAEKGYLWASQGWMFFLRTTGNEELELFLMDYLRSLSATDASLE